MGEAASVSLLVPQLDGADGVSELGRQVTRALVDGPGPALPLTVHSLHDRALTREVATGPFRFLPAGGRRTRFVARACAAAARAPQRHLALVLHLHLLPPALPFALRGTRLGAVVIGIESWTALPWLQRLGLERADCRVAISAHSRARFREANPGLAALPVTVCHPAAPRLAPPEAPDETPGYVLTVGRMAAAERYKGHDALLEAWPRVCAAVPDARLVVAGDGDDRPRLEARAAALGVASSVTFRGHVPAARLSALYRSAACLAMASRDEGFGFVYLEAMQAGCPCVVSPGAPTEIVRPDEAGLAVAYGDGPALAEACARLLTDRALRDRLGARAAAVAAGEFGFEGFARRLRAALSLPVD